MAAAIATLALVQALAPQPASTRPVIVAARSLPTGRTLQAGDLRQAHFPEHLVPQGAVAGSDALVGRVLAAPASDGTPLTRSAVVSTSTAADAGQVLVPFTVADVAVLTLVRPGDRVSVVASGNGAQPATIAHRVRVVTIPESRPGAGAGQAAQLVVSADPATAGRLASAAASQPLGITVG